MTIYSNDDFVARPQNRGHAGHTGAIGRSLRRWLRELRAWSAQAGICRRDTRALEELPDYLLRDIGVDRSNLREMVYFGDPSRRTPNHRP